MIAAVAMSIFHPGYFFIEPTYTYVEPVEERWPGGAHYEKARAIEMNSPLITSPMMQASPQGPPSSVYSKQLRPPPSQSVQSSIYSQQLEPPPPVAARYECWDDRRSWI